MYVTAPKTTCKPNLRKPFRETVFIGVTQTAIITARIVYLNIGPICIEYEIPKYLFVEHILSGIYESNDKLDPIAIAIVEKFRVIKIVSKETRFCIIVIFSVTSLLPHAKKAGR